MKKWAITYLDGTTEEVQGHYFESYEGVLHLQDYEGSTQRSWPLTSLRSWAVS